MSFFLETVLLILEILKEIFPVSVLTSLCVWRLSFGQEPEESKLCGNSVNYDLPVCCFNCLLWRLEMWAWKRSRYNTNTNTRYNTICHWEELFETLMWNFQSNKKQLWKRRVYMCTQLWIMNQVCVASRKVASHERAVLCCTCTVVQLTVMRMTTRMVWNLEKNEGSVEQLERNATVHVLCHLLPPPRAHIPIITRVL